MTPERFQVLLADWLAKVERMDLAEFLISVSHPSVVVRTPNGQVGGPQLIRDYTGHLRTAFPDLEMIVDHIGLTQDRVIFQFTLEGSHTGPLGFILPTHRRISSPAALVARVEDDERIHELWAYINMVVALLGAIDEQSPGVAPTNPLFPSPSTQTPRFPRPFER
ncbi:MAG: hypothetical protein AMXMBFR23_06220 [Chloroflexota bacterium]